jgi:hypothetical protein
MYNSEGDQPGGAHASAALVAAKEQLLMKSLLYPSRAEASRPASVMR